MRSLVKLHQNDALAFNIFLMPVFLLILASQTMSKYFNLFHCSKEWLLYCVNNYGIVVMPWHQYLFDACDFYWFSNQKWCEIFLWILMFWNNRKQTYFKRSFIFYLMQFYRFNCISFLLLSALIKGLIWLLSVWLFIVWWKHFFS